MLGTFASPNAKDSNFALPNAKNTNMLVSLELGDANFSRYLTQNPQRESVEYRLRWVPNAKLLRWPCTFHVFLCRFHLRLVPNANPVSSGIWAYVILVGFALEQTFRPSVSTYISVSLSFIETSSTYSLFHELLLRQIVDEDLKCNSIHRTIYLCNIFITFAGKSSIL